MVKMDGFRFGGAWVLALVCFFGGACSNLEIPRDLPMDEAGKVLDAKIPAGTIVCGYCEKGSSYKAHRCWNCKIELQPIKVPSIDEQREAEEAALARMDKKKASSGWKEKAWEIPAPPPFWLKDLAPPRRASHKYLVFTGIAENWPTEADAQDHALENARARFAAYALHATKRVSQGFWESLRTPDMKAETLVGWRGAFEQDLTAAMTQRSTADRVYVVASVMNRPPVTQVYDASVLLVVPMSQAEATVRDAMTRLGASITEDTKAYPENAKAFILERFETFKKNMSADSYREYNAGDLSESAKVETVATPGGVQ